jgi:hypothetical protein
VFDLGYWLTARTQAIEVLLAISPSQFSELVPIQALV